MKIIRDDELGGLAMIPLFVDWNIRRCNWRGCRERPNTICVTRHEGESLHFGLCEEHYQRGNVPGGCDMPLEFDGHDAFKQAGSVKKGEAAIAKAGPMGEVGDGTS